MATLTPEQLRASRSALVKKGKKFHAKGRNFPKVSFPTILKEMADELEVGSEGKIKEGLTPAQAICLWHLGKYGKDKPEIEYLILAELSRRHSWLSPCCKIMRDYIVQDNA
jgi:hypothetical protein